MLKKLIVFGIILNFFEWYELVVYDHLETFTELRILGHPLDAAPILVALFWVSMQILGAFLLAVAARRLNIHALLLIPLTLLALPGVIIGLLPTGAWPLFVSLRILQLMGAGAAPVAALCLVDDVPRRWRYWVLCGMVTGIFLALLFAMFTLALLSNILGSTPWKEWGWRLVFLVNIFWGGLLFVIKYGYLRSIWKILRPPKHIFPQTLRCNSLPWILSIGLVLLLGFSLGNAGSTRIESLSVGGIFGALFMLLAWRRMPTYVDLVHMTWHYIFFFGLQYVFPDMAWPVGLLGFGAARLGIAFLYTIQQIFDTKNRAFFWAFGIVIPFIVCKHIEPTFPSGPYIPGIMGLLLMRALGRCSQEEV